MRKSFFLIPLTLWLVSCQATEIDPSANENEPQQMAKVDVVIGAPLPGIASENLLAAIYPSQIQSIDLTISASDISTPIHAPRITTPASLPITFNGIDIPIGPSRLFEVTVTTSIGLHAQFYGNVMANITSAGGTVPIDLNWLNFVEDEILPSDVVSSANTDPNIAGFEIFHTSVDSSPCQANTIKMTLKLQSDFQPPFTTANGFIKTIFEFDLDSNQLTGSSSSYIARRRGSTSPSILGANMPSGTEFALEVTGPSFSPSTSVIAIDPANDDTVLSLFPVTAFYDANVQTMFVCMNAPAFFELDPERSGVMNILIGRENLGNFVPNDIAYRGGRSINYKLP